MTEEAHSSPNGSAKSMAQRLAVWCLLGLAGWTTVYVVRATVATQEVPAASPDLPPWAWELGAPGPEPLRALLREVREVLPPDSRLMLDSYRWGAPGDILILLAWVRYGLVEQRVSAHIARPKSEAFLLVYPAGPSRLQGATVVLDHEHATLYSVAP